MSQHHTTVLTKHSIARLFLVFNAIFVDFKTSFIFENVVLAIPILFLISSHHFAVVHWFDCRATEPGFAGDIGAIEV